MVKDFDKKEMFEVYGKKAIEVLTHKIYEPIVLGHEIIGHYGPEKAVALGIIFREKEVGGIIKVGLRALEFFLHMKKKEIVGLLGELEKEDMAIEVVDFKDGEFFLKINYRTFFIHTLEHAGIENADRDIVL